MFDIGLVISWFENLDIVVTNLSYATNTGNVWIPIDQNINETDQLNFQIDAYDPEGNPMDYSWKLDGLEVSTTNTSSQLREKSQHLQ